MDEVNLNSGYPSSPDHRKKVAVLGAGISGLSAAWLLGKTHEVTLYEAADTLGGHSHTVDVTVDGKTLPVDTGFIVFNPKNYPNLTALFDHLDVATQRTDMSFSVSRDDGRFEYAGGDGGGLFAQTSNILRPRFWRMLAGIIRFYKNSDAYQNGSATEAETLGQFLAREKYSADFYADHLGPMGAAIWSSDCANILEYPARSFISFFNNHGLTRYSNRPQWRTVSGGSREYVKRLEEEITGTVLLDSRVSSISQVADSWQVIANDKPERFDHIVFACHSDQALSLLENTNLDAAHALRSIRYAGNQIVLHSDPALMPKRRRAWASWNYVENPKGGGRPGVSYWMNQLQHLPVETPVIATLNAPFSPNPNMVLGTYDYAHPVFDATCYKARKDIWKVQGQHGLWFCGAYLGDGFHEDGIQSGLAVAEMLGGLSRPWHLRGQNARIGLPDRLLKEGVSP